jgi:hypothetical protein
MKMWYLCSIKLSIFTNILDIQVCLLIFLTGCLSNESNLSVLMVRIKVSAPYNTVVTCAH